MKCRRVLFVSFTFCWLVWASTSNGSAEGVGDCSLPPETVELSKDVQVNEPDPENEGMTAIQAETSVRINPDTGTICVAYNDGSFTKYSRSIDGGATFVDGGQFQTFSGADSSMVWRTEDESFYYVAFNNTPTEIWRSEDDCETFSLLTVSVTQGDRPMTAIDNNPQSDYPGRIYIAANGIRIAHSIAHSDDGVTWSREVQASLPTTGIVELPWPAVDQTTGHVYIAYTERTISTNMIRIWVVKSINGGDSWSPLAFPLDWTFNPGDPAASERCGKRALRGDIFIKSGPQIAVDNLGHLHIVYMRDPDGADVGDVADVYYRRSTDQGIIWEPEIRLNDDATHADQWNPALSVGPTGVVAVSWYDRRNDQPGNVKFDRYLVLSKDNGVTWEANLRVSDVSSNVAPAIDLSKQCYHGEYDQQVQDEDYVYVLWSDDRNPDQECKPNPDVWFEKVPTHWIFKDGFEDGSAQAVR